MPGATATAFGGPGVVESSTIATNTSREGETPEVGLDGGVPLSSPAEKKSEPDFADQCLEWNHRRFISTVVCRLEALLVPEVRSEEQTVTHGDAGFSRIPGSETALQAAPISSSESLRTPIDGHALAMSFGF